RLEDERTRAWQIHATRRSGWLVDRAAPAFDRACDAEIARTARAEGAWTGPAPSLQAGEVNVHLDQRFASDVMLWPASKADLVREMDSVLQMPGWGNIWTQ